MQPDIQTIFLANVVAGFVIALSVAAAGYRRKPELMLWSAAMALLGVTYTLFSFRDLISDFLSIVLANMAVSAIFAVIAEGFFLFLRKSPPRLLIWMPVALTAIGFTCWVDNYPIRLVLSSTILGSQAFLLVFFAIQNRQIITGRGKYIYGGGAFFIAVMQVIKLVTVSNTTRDSTAFLAPTFLNASNHLIAMVTVIILIVGLLLMTWERDERTLMESENRLLTLFNSTSDAMMLFSENAFVDCNRATLKLFGCASIKDFVKHTPADLSPKTQPNGMASEGLALEQIQKAISDSSTRFDWVHKKLDTGESFNAEVLLHAIQIDGKTALLAIVRDITERKAYQLELEKQVLARTEELATARDEAEAASAVKTRFMENVSHEMRTPMLSILGFSEIGKKKAANAPAEKIIGYFDNILESGKRLHSLTESLLTLAEDAWNEQSGIENRNLQIVQLVPLVTECIQLMDKAAATKQQKVVFENNSVVEWIRGDKSRLRQVVEHLLSNALRFSPSKSIVTVRISDASASVGAVQKIKIQVADQGCGIPEKEMRAIFEPFYESSRTATGAGSTGLGLPLCKSIVQRHKGSIAVTNQPEGGAIFEITLPIEVTA